VNALTQINCDLSELADRLKDVRPEIGHLPRPRQREAVHATRSEVLALLREVFRLEAWINQTGEDR
jgi:hypothetical protein